MKWEGCNWERVCDDVWLNGKLSVLGVGFGIVIWYGGVFFVRNDFLIGSWM